MSEADPPDRVASQAGHQTCPSEFRVAVGLAVQAAVVSGALPRITEQVCASCGAPARHYHHHKGYEPAHWLDVTPLCLACHWREHRGRVRPKRAKRVPPVRVAIHWKAPEGLYVQLVALAERESRSVPQQVIACLKECLARRTRGAAAPSR